MLSSVVTEVKREKILVVPKDRFAANLPENGFFSYSEEGLKALISNQGFYKERNLVEQDESLKQIIPYLVFEHQDQVFLMKRASKQKIGEIRLADKFCLGIGGHLRQEDLEKANTISQWAEREFNEEVNYQDKLSYNFLGLINNETSSVGRVHVGALFILKGSTADISIKSEFAFGKLVHKKELVNYYDEMEDWSKVLVDSFYR